MRYAAFVTSALLLIAGTGAKAQNPTGINRGASAPLMGRIDADRTYFVQNPEMIVGGDVTSVLFSPDSRLLLAARETRTATPASLAGKPSLAPGEVSINVWRARTRRVAVLWRRALEPGQTASCSLKGWMGDRGVALGTVYLTTSDKETGKLTSATHILFLDTVSGTTREITDLPKTYWGLSLSPTKPFAALLNAEGGNSDTLRFLRQDGTFSAPLPIPSFVWFTRWSEDGASIRGLSLVPGKTEPEWIAADPVAMTVTKIPPPPKNANGETDYGPENPGQENLPLKLTQRPSSPPPSEGGRSREPEVWLEDARNPKVAVRLTREGVPFGILPNLSGVVYRVAGGLFLAPIMTAEKGTVQ